MRKLSIAGVDCGRRWDSAAVGYLSDVPYRRRRRRSDYCGLSFITGARGGSEDAARRPTPDNIDFVPPPLPAPPASQHPTSSALLSRLPTSSKTIYALTPRRTAQIPAARPPCNANPPTSNEPFDRKSLGRDSNVAATVHAAGKIGFLLQLKW